MRNWTYPLAPILPNPQEMSENGNLDKRIEFSKFRSITSLFPLHAVM